MIGGFNEHSAEVHCFVERAAEAGAVKLAQKAGLGYEEARAELRTRFRRRLSVGGWRDFYAHLCARIPYINPSPAAEAKLLAQRREVDYRWAQKRAAVHQRRLGEGELWSPGSFGHGGATGTQMWVDPQSEVTCVLLTNDPQGAGALRPKVANAVAAAAL